MPVWSDYINIDLDLYGVCLSGIIVIFVPLVLLILQSVLSFIFGWGGGEAWFDAENIAHNTKLALTGKVNPDIKQKTTIGWRHDPINLQDGYTEVEGQTVSGNREYTKRLN